MTTVLAPSHNLDPVYAHLKRLDVELFVGMPPVNRTVVPAAAFLDDATFRAALTTMDYPDTSDSRALASIWTKHYLSATGPAIVLLHAFAGVIAECALDAISLVVEPHGPAGLVLNERVFDTATTPTPESYRHVLETLFTTNYDPLFHDIQRRMRLAPRVMWVNAANLFFTIGQALDRLLPEIGAAHRAFLAETDLGGRLRPGYLQEVITLRSISGPWGTHTGRLRKVCCLANFAHSDGHYCSTCPHISDQEVHDKLMARWQSQ